MAWVTPKTNWAAADGVRNTDLNRIEANTLELYNTLALRHSVTVYVATTGNDATGNGSSSAPYKTVAKALSVIPRNINGYAATINIAAGTYNEYVTIQDYCGLITLTGSGTVTFTTFTVSRCTVLLTSANFVATQGAHVNYNGSLHCLSSLATGSAVGLNVTEGSRAVVATLTATNAGVAAVFVQSASMAYITTFNGSGVNVGLFAANGGIIGVGTYNAAVTGARYSTNHGGRIYTGSQTSVPSY